MIEKLNTAYIQVESDSNAKLELANKINELVDAVNKQDKAIRLLINGLECFAKGQQLMNTEIEIKG